MIIYDVDNPWVSGSPYLSKFEGRMSELGEKHRTYKSFEKAKKIVLDDLNEELTNLKKKIAKVESIASGDDLEMQRNPFTGYLRELHGELK